MSYLLVATDFTETGDHSVDYAAQMAVSLNLNLCIAHFYVLPITYGEIPMPELSVSEIKKMDEGTMGELVTQLKKRYPTLSVTYTVQYDDVTFGIREHCDKHGAPMMVVIGNSLNNATLTLISNTVVDTFKHLNIPVLAVPGQAGYTPVKNICFAYDNKHDPKIEIALTQLKSICQTLAAKLFVFHVQKDVMTRDNLTEFDPKTLEFLKELAPKYHVEYDVEIGKAMEHYVAEEQINWVAVLPHTYSFLESIFHKSHSKALAQKIKVPLLVLHERA